MDLAEALAADVHDAFPVLVRDYGGAVYSAALRLCGRGPAEDIAQETFAKAYAALERYEPDRVRGLELRPWVLTIALNVARNHLRDAARHLQGSSDGNGQAPAPTDGATTAELRMDLGDALLRLPLPTRQAVVLRHVVGCSTAEVAAILDRPPGTVKSQVARGLAALRDHLEDR